MNLGKRLLANSAFLLAAGLGAAFVMDVIPLPGGGEPGTPSRAVGVVVFFGLYASFVWCYQRRQASENSTP